MKPYLIRKRAYIEPVSVLSRKDYIDLLKLAFKEDMVSNDITTKAMFPGKKMTIAQLLSKQNGVLCGSEIFAEAFRRIDRSINVRFIFEEGQDISSMSTVAEISGNVQSILRAERIALNFISMLSGIAGKTRAAVDLLKKTGIIPLDTRKTIPGYRKLSKYAVYIGGGCNHRLNLSQMGLIKDNHIAALGGVKNAVRQFRAKYPDHKCEVEVVSLIQLKEALEEKPDMILLDNMSPALLKKCSKLIKIFNQEFGTQITSEASGGFNLENLNSIATTGVDFVSMGSLTNNILPHDFSLEF